MANPTLRRLKQLEKRLDKIDSRTREKPGVVLYIDREQFDRANAQHRKQNRITAAAQTETPPTTEPFMTRAKTEDADAARLRRMREQDAAYEAEFEAEFSDKARAKRIRDLARANEARSKLIW